MQKQGRCPWRRSARGGRGPAHREAVVDPQGNGSRRGFPQWRRCLPGLPGRRSVGHRAAEVGGKSAGNPRSAVGGRAPPRDRESAMSAGPEEGRDIPRPSAATSNDCRRREEAEVPTSGAKRSAEGVPADRRAQTVGSSARVLGGDAENIPIRNVGIEKPRPRRGTRSSDGRRTVAQYRPQLRGGRSASAGAPRPRGRGNRRGREEASEWRPRRRAARRRFRSEPPSAVPDR